jgi:NADH-quinone oxidoreductase subunit L
MFDALWLVVALPLAGFVVLLFGGKRLGDLAAAIAVGIMAVDAALAVGLLLTVLRGINPPVWQVVWWNGGSPVTVGLALDHLSAVMIVMVALVSALVHIFSVGYMAGDTRYPLYFAYLQLFSASMLALVMADGLAGLYIAWELVGLSSYLLIGFWFERPAAADAAKKAFIVTRLGDVGLLIGVLVLGLGAGSFRFADVFAAVGAGRFEPWVIGAAALLLFAGAVGKSAQFPLFVWLPDAMEGPTPVSALIHAATMVAAGVYLVARTFPVFEASTPSLAVVAGIGALTALGAALVAVTQTDLKRVLAYSTISQLGLMFLGLGAGQREAAVFHLINHAGFKALLFLGAGAVIHATGEQDIRKMGGLIRRMPLTGWTFVIGAAALAGVPPLSGFWSKDELLGGALAAGHPVLFAIGLATSLLTAVYAFRLVFTVFFGEGPERYSGAGADGWPHEVEWSMGIPLVALSAVAVLSGFLGGPVLDFSLERLIILGPDTAHFDPLLAGAAAAVAALGICLAWLGWGRGRLAGDRLLEGGVEPSPGRPASAIRRGAAALYAFVASGFGVDALYDRVIVAGTLTLARRGAAVDDDVIDGAVQGVGRAAMGGGWLVSMWQSGKMSRYFVAMLAGIALIAAAVISLARFGR